ncbi:hypothetical protein QQF73_08545 [Marinobacter sp. M216]|uniref:ATP-grasp domain-containing protein n=1 Tax=Marinobacter albus TaxID=3030833 RepID=A0ABT7HBC1_9GAMM|nr:MULTISPECIES: hypothetical protein [unclassified Marinobacter]MBW7470067.1 hypothetical protein [Marinobacter sp. F4218]MDK9557669.1 hypothetical protein [Marinobacter sp. M216]
MPSPYVIILANGLNGLGAIRSAAQAGLKAYTLITKRSDLSTYSRFSEVTFLVPPNPSLADLRPILDRLFIRENGPGVLLACSDNSAELLGELKNEGYSKHHLIVPSMETTRILNDKKLECRAMEQGGIALPKTYYQLSVNDPESFPLIIKPRTFRDYQILGAKNVILYTQTELDEFRQRFRGQVERFIGQEVIQGADDNLWVCNVTFNLQKEMSACFLFQRLGTMPSHYGVTSLAISRENMELREECEKIGKALNYCGPAMIEFKKDPVSGRYLYIETNPRLGMCNWFDTRCGINNILACTRVAYGQEVAFGPQTNNVVYWNFFGDLIARLEDRENIFSILFLYLRLLFRRRIGALFYWRDPIPACKYSWDAIKNIFRRTNKKLRRRFS